MSKYFHNFLLNLGTKGNEVHHLHCLLQNLGYTIPPRESEEKHFGESTAKAVEEFQERNGLSPTGQVDEVTASRLQEVYGDSNSKASRRKKRKK